MTRCYGSFYSHCKNFSVAPLIFQKITKLPFFSLHTPSPSLPSLFAAPSPFPSSTPPLSGATPSSPPSLAPSLSGAALSPPPFLAPLISIAAPSPPLSQAAPPLQRRLRLLPSPSHLLPLHQHPPSSALPPSPPPSPAHPHSPAPALFQRSPSAPVSSPLSGTGPAPPPPASAPRSVKQDRTEGLYSVLFGRTKTILFDPIGQTEWKASVQPNGTERRPSLRPCLAEWCRGEGGRRGPERTGAEKWTFGRTEALPSALFGRTVPRGGEAPGVREGRCRKVNVWPNGGPLFGPIWPNVAEKRGGVGGRRGPVPRSEEETEDEGALKEGRCQGVRVVLGKGEKMGDGGMERRGRRWGARRSAKKKEGDGAREETWGEGGAVPRKRKEAVPERKRGGWGKGATDQRGG